MGQRYRQRNPMTLGGGPGGHRSMDTVIAQQGGKIASPGSKFSGFHARGIVVRVLEDAEHLVREHIGDGPGHPHEPSHEKIDRILEVYIE